MKKSTLLMMVAIVTNAQSITDSASQTFLSTAAIDAPIVIEGKKDFFQAGSFFFGGQPDEEVFRWLSNEGVTVVINLRTAKEMEALIENKFDEAAVLKELGMNYVHIPIGGSDGYAPHQVDSLARTLARHSGKALIHCAGAGRVSYLWAAYLITYRGLTIDEAIEIGKKIKLFLPPIEELLGYPLTIQRDVSLHEAVRNGNSAQVLKILIHNSKLVNAKDESGYTPLYIATRENRIEIAQNLIEHGADVNVKDNNSIVPLHLAAYRGNKELVDLYIRNGADVNSKSNTGATPFHFAAQNGHQDVVDQLITAKANVNAADMLGNAPLLIAALYGQNEMVKFLIDKSASPNIKNNRGNTPVDVAERENHKEIVDLLMAKGSLKAQKKNPVLKGDYVGQKKPGMTPLIFAPNFVSTEKNQLNAVFSVDGNSFYYTERNLPGKMTIMETRRMNNRWTTPKAVAFSGKYADVDHFLCHDGKTLLFCSNRHLDGSDTPKNDFDFWSVAKEKDGWSEPQHMGFILNSESDDFYPTMTNEGTLYFSSGREGSLGENDVFFSKIVNGHYTKPENSGAAINTKFREFDPFIAPDESYLIFSSIRPDGFGDSDLYISVCNDDGLWTKAQNMGATINTSYAEYTPMLSSDGKYFFFTSRRAGVDDLYWVDATVIGHLKPNEHVPKK